MYVVLDTNVLVSALWSENGVCARILSMVLNGLITPCYDHRVLEEYRMVLLRPRFRFSENDVEDILSYIRASGMSVIAPPLPIDLPDMSDKKFFEIGIRMDAAIVTGNIKHFPAYEKVFSPVDFLKHFFDV